MLCESLTDMNYCLLKFKYESLKMALWYVQLSIIAQLFNLLDEKSSKTRGSFAFLENRF